LTRLRTAGTLPLQYAAIISPKPKPLTPLPRLFNTHHSATRSFLLFIGSVIGSGVFLTPGLILRQLDGSVGYAFLVWIIGRHPLALGALTYAELAARNPKPAAYTFSSRWLRRMPSLSLRMVFVPGDRQRPVAALARAFTRYLAESSS